VRTTEQIRVTPESLERRRASTVPCPPDDFFSRKGHQMKIVTAIGEYSTVVQAIRNAEADAQDLLKAYAAKGYTLVSATAQTLCSTGGGWNAHIITIGLERALALETIVETRSDIELTDAQLDAVMAKVKDYIAAEAHRTGRIAHPD
jgi:hypothetical protein